MSSVKSAYNVQSRLDLGKHINTFVEDVKSLFNENLHKLLLTLPVGGVLIFTILPLIFMISMAFTNYSKVDSHLVLFDWVGLENFKQLFDSGSSIGHSFWSVLGWTIIWAIFATGLNYILGILVALLINRKGTRAAIASRVARTAVFRLDFTATLRLWAFSLVRTRFFCDLMFATISPNDVFYKDIQTMMITWRADKSPTGSGVSRLTMPILAVRIVCVEYFKRRMAWASSITSPVSPISR